MKKQNVLIVEDHLMIIEGYKNVLRKHFQGKLDLRIDHAVTCKEAYNKIVFKSKIKEFYDVICLDMNLPAAEDLNIFSGEDLGIWIKEESPLSKLIVMTMYSDNYRLYNILKNLQPNVFILKQDVDSAEFVLAFKKCLSGDVYYSASVGNFLRSSFSTDITLDNYDRSILYYLSNGVQTKDLLKYIPLSLAGIEKRKRTMKELFDIQGGDLKLVNCAKKSGFL